MKLWASWPLLLLGCGLWPVLAGCDAKPSVAPVSGRVLLDGAPLAGAHLTFEPVPTEAELAAPISGSWAVTDAQGKFALRQVRSDQLGATPGPHRVNITTARAEDPRREESPVSPERVPPHYRGGALTFDVPPTGTTAAEFDLRSTTQSP